MTNELQQLTVDLEKAQADVARLRTALIGLRYHREPERFCDHAADPCQRCEAASFALSFSGPVEEG